HMNIAYLLHDLIVAIAPADVDPQAEGIVFDDTYPDATGLEVGDRQVAPGQFARPVVVVAAPVTEITPADFKRRFTIAEWVAAWNLAKTDGLMAYFFDTLRLVDVVHLEHPDT